MDKMSPIVFEQNTGAKALSEREGFVETMRVPVVSHPLIQHDGGALLMAKELEDEYPA